MVKQVPGRVNLVVLDGDGQDSRLEQEEEEEEPVVLDESMLQGQFLLYRTYQGEPVIVQEEQTVVLDDLILPTNGSRNS